MTIDTTNLWDGLIIMGIYFLGMFAGKFLWVNPNNESKGSDIKEETKEISDETNNSKKKPIWTSSSGDSNYRGCVYCLLHGNEHCPEHSVRV